MIYGSSSAQSALGSLLRKMQEETMTNPAKVPINAGESSPIREQIQGPLSNSESIGSEKVVAMKPEMAPSQETPNPVAANNMINPIPTGVSAAAAGSPTVVGPTNIETPSSPEIASGIISPTSPKPSIQNNATPSVSLPNTGVKSPSTSLATAPLQPSSSKSMAQTLASINNSKGTIAKPSTYTGSKVGGTTENIGIKAGSGAGIGATIKAGAQLIPTVLKGVLSGASSLAGTIMPKTTLNQIMQNLKYGGRKVTQI